MGGIGDYSESIDGVATETRKVCLPPLLYAGGFSLFMSVSVEKYSSSGRCSARFTTHEFLSEVAELRTQDNKSEEGGVLVFTLRRNISTSLSPSL